MCNADSLKNFLVKTHPCEKPRKVRKRYSTTLNLFISHNDSIVQSYNTTLLSNSLIFMPSNSPIFMPSYIIKKQQPTGYIIKKQSPRSQLSFTCLAAPAPAQAKTEATNVLAKGGADPSSGTSRYKLARNLPSFGRQQNARVFYHPTPSILCKQASPHVQSTTLDASPQ